MNNEIKGFIFVGHVKIGSHEYCNFSHHSSVNNILVLSDKKFRKKFIPGHRYNLIVNLNNMYEPEIKKEKKVA